MKILVRFHAINARNTAFVVARKLIPGAGAEFEDRAVRVGEEAGEGREELFGAEDGGSCGEEGGGLDLMRVEREWSGGWEGG